MLVTLKTKNPEFENWNDVAVKEDHKVDKLRKTFIFIRSRSYSSCWLVNYRS